MLMGVLLTLLFSCMNNEYNLNAKVTGSFTDLRDGRIYKTVKIGDQWIMAENFAYKPVEGNFWVYENDPVNIDKYGYLYDWETAKKIAPEGWHLPSKKEWKTFRKSLGARMDVWSTMDKVYRQMIAGGGSGFNALFGGRFDFVSGEYRNIGKEAYFWSSTLTCDGPTNYVLERESADAFLTDYGDPRGGKSVRLFKDLPSR